MSEQNFYTILTAIGKAKIANAHGNRKALELKEMAVGDGGGAYYNPSESAVALKNEVYRRELNNLSSDAENANYLVCEMIIPSTAGGFYVREAGLFDVDGDMIAIGKVPETYKPELDSGAAKDLYMRFVIEVANASAVTLKIDPSVILATKEMSEKAAADAVSGHVAQVNPHNQYVMKTAYSENLNELQNALENKENTFAVLPISKGGSGGTTVEEARTNLGLDEFITGAGGTYLKHSANALTWGNSNLSSVYGGVSGNSSGLSVTGKVGINVAPGKSMLSVFGQTYLSDTTAPAPDSSHALIVGGSSYFRNNIGINTTPTAGESLIVSGNSMFTGSMGIGTAPDSAYTLKVNGRIFLTNSIHCAGEIYIEKEAYPQIVMNTQTQSWAIINFPNDQLYIYDYNKKLTVCRFSGNGTVFEKNVGILTEIDSAYALKVAGDTNIVGSAYIGNTKGKLYVNDSDGDLYFTNAKTGKTTRLTN